MIDVKDAEEFTSLVNSNQNLIVDFTATWCPPCRAIAPILEQAVARHASIKLIKLDVDKVPAVAAQYKIASLPTVVFVKDGAAKDTFVGARDAAYIEQFIAKNSN